MAEYEHQRREQPRGRNQEAVIYRGEGPVTWLEDVKMLGCRSNYYMVI
jgi:hypothetical protein